MKTLVSIALGAAMLFGAATLGLQSGVVTASERQNPNQHSTRHHRHHHHKHKHHQQYKNKLSY